MPGIVAYTQTDRDSIRMLESLKFERSDGL
jgi:hypothetical protein